MQTTRLTLAQLLAAHLVAARAVGGEMNNGLLLVRGLLRVVAVLLRGLGLLLRLSRLLVTRRRVRHSATLREPYESDLVLFVAVLLFFVEVVD